MAKALIQIGKRMKSNAPLLFFAVLFACSACDEVHPPDEQRNIPYEGSKSRLLQQLAENFDPFDPPSDEQELIEWNRKFKQFMEGSPEFEQPSAERIRELKEWNRAYEQYLEETVDARKIGEQIIHLLKNPDKTDFEQFIGETAVFVDAGVNNYGNDLELKGIYLRVLSQGNADLRPQAVLSTATIKAKVVEVIPQRKMIIVRVLDASDYIPGPST